MRSEPAILEKNGRPPEPVSGINFVGYYGRKDDLLVTVTLRGCVAQRPLYTSPFVWFEKEGNRRNCPNLPKSKSAKKFNLLGSNVKINIFWNCFEIWHTIATLLHFSNQNISWLRYCVGVFYLRHDYTPVITVIIFMAVYIANSQTWVIYLICR